MYVSLTLLHRFIYMQYYVDYISIISGLFLGIYLHVILYGLYQDYLYDFYMDFIWITYMPFIWITYNILSGLRT